MSYFAARPLGLDDSSSEELREEFLALVERSSSPAADAIRRGLKVAGSMLKIRIFRAEDDSLEWYVVMISIFQDSLLIKLSKTCGFPRGFPVVWFRNKHAVSFGFRPKFSNDNNKQSAFLFPPDEVIASIKWSGCLGQLVPFVHPVTNELGWTSTTKNSADAFSPLGRAIADAWARVVTPGLLQELVDTNRHLCAEVMLDIDKVHGHDYKHDNGSTVVITSCGKGNDWRDAEKDTAAVVFDDNAYMTKLCERHGLIVAPALHIRGWEACDELLEALGDNRDMMDAAKFCDLAMRLVDKHDAVVYGCLEDHIKICGRVLEGWVIMGRQLNEYDAAPRPFEVVKYKLPRYTIRTMFLRDMMGGINGDALPVSPIQAYKMLMAYVHRWTTTHTKYWTHAGWELYLRWREAGCPMRKPGDALLGLAAPHITLADEWEREGCVIRPDIQAELDRVRDTAMVLVAPFVVFASAEDAHRLARELTDIGLPVKSELRRGLVSTQAPMVYVLSEKPGKRVNMLPTAISKTHKMFGVDDAPRIDPTVEAVVRVLHETGCLVEDSKGVAEVERLLRKASDEFVQFVVKKFESNPDAKLLVLPSAPQCTGKTTAAERVRTALGADCVDIFSADVFMAALTEDGLFDAKMLGPAHEACARAAMASTKKVVIIDNTNFPTDTGVYSLIAELRTREVVRIPYADKVWGSGAKDITMMQALLARNVRRDKHTIDPEVIFRTVDKFATNMRAFPDAHYWVGSYTPETPRNGTITYINGALAYQGRDLTMEMRKMLRHVEYGDHINKTLRDGYNEYHVTILTPSEKRKHNKAQFLPKTMPTCMGLGMAEKGNLHAWYAIMEWPEAAEFRAKLKLPPLDFHCTLGFGDGGDVHGVSKGIETRALTSV